MAAIRNSLKKPFMPSPAPTNGTTIPCQYFEKIPVPKPQAELLAGRYDDNGNLINVREGNNCLLMSINGAKTIKLHRVMRNCFASRQLQKLACFSVNGLSFQMPWDGKPKRSEKARRLRGNEHHLVEWLLLGEPDKAFEHCVNSKNGELHSSNVSIDHLNELGDRWLAEGKNTEAICAFQVNLMLHPDNGSAYEKLGEIHSRFGNNEFGIKNIKNLLDVAPTW